MSIKPLILHNLEYLRQAQGLLDSMDKAAFTECRPPWFSSSVGDHLRHIVEHYQCFVAGIPKSRVDYDARLRDASIATDQRLANLAIAQLRDELNGMELSDAELRVRLDGDPKEGDADPWSRSTRKRELQYLQAHTVHHFALINFILRLQGTEPDPAFGVAPSTLRFRASLAAQAD